MKRAELATAAGAGASAAQVDDIHRFVIASLGKIGGAAPGALAAFFEAASGGGGEAFGRGRALESALTVLSDQARNASVTPEVFAAARAGAVIVAEAAVAFRGRAWLILFENVVGAFDDILALAEIWKAPLGDSVRLPFQTLRPALEDVLSRLRRMLDDLEK